MNFPITFDDISLWIAITAIILWITLEVILVRYEKTKYRIERKKLKKITLMISILFMLTVVIRAIAILLL